MSTIDVAPTMDNLPYDILMKIIQNINTLNAVFLCRLEEVSKSFQLCANNAKTWYNIYNMSKKEVRDWCYDVNKRQKVSRNAFKKATANRNASLSIIDELAYSLSCKHCCECDPRPINEIINEQTYFMIQYEIDPGKYLLDELTLLMINKQCTKLCTQKNSCKYKGYGCIYDKKSDAILSWKLYPLVRIEANIDKTMKKYQVCREEKTMANIIKMMMARSLVDPEYRPNKPRNTQN